MFKLVLISSVLAQPRVLTYVFPGSPKPASKYFSVYAIHQHNILAQDSVEISIKQDGTTTFSCQHALGESCSKPSHPRAQFNLSTLSVTFMTPDLYIVASDMGDGWDTRSYGYGKKEYYANSNLC